MPLDRNVLAALRIYAPDPPAEEVPPVPLIDVLVTEAPEPASEAAEPGPHAEWERARPETHHQPEDRVEFRTEAENTGPDRAGNAPARAARVPRGEYAVLNHVELVISEENPAHADLIGWVSRRHPRSPAYLAVLEDWCRATFRYVPVIEDDAVHYPDGGAGREYAVTFQTFADLLAFELRWVRQWRSGRTDEPERAARPF